MEPWLISILVSLAISCAFILIIDVTKFIFKKYYADSNENNYMTDEFKFIFLSTFTYLLLLILILGKIEQFVGINIIEFLMNEISLSNSLFGFLFAIILNMLLYLGYLYQILLGIEGVNKSQNYLIMIKERIYGPFLEEIIYRAFIYNFLKILGNFSYFNSSLLCSLMFGLCIKLLK